MYPGFRGRQGNPGLRTGFSGERDDLLAAVRYLAARPDTDPERIYLVGHSTGATLALLFAARTEPGLLRGVFALGPTDHLSNLPPQYVPAGATGPELDELSSVNVVESITTSTVVIEGRWGASASAERLLERKGGAPLRVHVVPDADHFTLIAPALEVVAHAIERDSGPAPQFPEVNDGVLLRSATGRRRDAGYDPGTHDIVRALDDDELREYTVHVPQGTSGALPLIVALHGDAPADDPRALLEELILPGLGELETVVVVPRVGAEGWHTDASLAGLRLALSEARERVAIDSRRTLLLGHDLGGTACGRSWALWATSSRRA